MIKFNKTIVQFGFGAVGKSFYEKVRKEISFNESKYFIITKEKEEFEAYMNLGGLVSNFIVCEITKENYEDVFNKYLNKGDLLIDFADTVGTKDILNYAIKKDIMYVNTGEADWPEHWYNIYEENKLKNEIKNNSKNNYPIVLQHGNNPGLVSHFVKSGLEYIINTQFKKDKKLKKLLKENKFNEIAYNLQLTTIHVNDNDLQKTNIHDNESLINSWCIDSFFFEMLSEATASIGTHEIIDYTSICKNISKGKDFLEFKSLAIDKKLKTMYPNGYFESYLVPHEETITIAKNLEVIKDNKVIYRPTVVFLYSPLDDSLNYFKNNKVNDYPNIDLSKPLDKEDELQSIIRGYIYPNQSNIIYKENIESGTEYVGVLLIGKNFKPVWVGNRIELNYLYKKKDSYWQTPTITPVSMSALAAVKWMMKNQDKKGIYFPDDILDYKEILKTAEKYISKTIYKTFDKSFVEKTLDINLSNVNLKDFFIK